MKRLWSIIGILVLAGAAAPENWIRRGNTAFEQGDYQMALDCYDRAADETHDPGQAAFNQGAAHYQLSEFAAAEACYRRCLEDAGGPRRVKALYGLANCLAQQGQARRGRGAIGQLRDAVEQYQASLSAAESLEPADFDDVRDILDNARFNLNLVKPLLEQRLADPSQENSAANPDSSTRPPDDSGNAFAARDPSARDQGMDGSRSSGRRGSPGTETPFPPDGKAQGTDETQPGRGNLPPLLDDKAGPPLTPEQAMDHLERNLDRIRRDRANRMKPPTANVKGVRDW
jgi:tetratricopeptide (TPR) repeat protein